VAGHDDRDQRQVRRPVHLAVRRPGARALGGNV
jgi:hypothetical protein